MMKIGLITTPLTDDNAIRGVGKYTRLIIESLTKHGQNVELIKGYSATEFRGKVDLIHYPFFDLFRVNLPYFKYCPTVVTVHDLIPIVYKNYFSIGIRGWLKWLVQKQSLLNVNHIITVSNASKRDIVRELGREKDVSVIYSYAEDNYRPQSEENVLKVKKRYELPDRYLLYVGDINWNKNIVGLIRVFAKLKENLKFDDLKLVLAGKSFLNKESAEAKVINSLIGDFDLQKEVLKTGFVVEEDLPALYRGSVMYLQFSLAEGFGLPVLEAMSSGAIVISSDRGGLKEISGPAYIVDPENVIETARLITRVTELTAEKRAGVIERNLNWVKNFNSNKFTRQLVECYEKILAGN